MTAIDNVYQPRIAECRYSMILLRTLHISLIMNEINIKDRNTWSIKNTCYMKFNNICGDNHDV